MDTLALYLSVVLATIAPHINQGRRDSIAADIATVTLSEERAFAGDETGQQTALLLVSLAHYETGRSWAAWVDDGRCNEPAWRERHQAWLRGGDCDGGKSFSMWQLYLPNQPELGRSLARDRRAAIRMALSKARASLGSGLGLCGYSGERYPNCRLARMRLETARNWVNMFPYNPSATMAAE